MPEFTRNCGRDDSAVQVQHEPGVIPLPLHRVGEVDVTGNQHAE